MKRRKFIKQVAGTVTAMSTYGIQSIDATPVDSDRENSFVDVKQLIERIDDINDAIDGEKLFEPPAVYLAKDGYSIGLIRGGVKALLLAGVYKDIDCKARAHHLIKERIQNEAGSFEQTTFSMATILENTNRQKRREIRDYLKKNSRSIQQFRNEFNHFGYGINVPQKRMIHFNEIFDRIYTYLSRRSDWRLLDDYISLVDEVAIKDGITPALRRKISRISDEETNRLLMASSESEYYGEDALLGSVSLQTGGDDYKKHEMSYRERKRRRRIRRGLILMGIGGIAGGIMLPVGASNIISGGEWLALGGTVGAIIFISGLIVTIAGLSIQISEEEKNSNERRKSNYPEKLKKAVQWVENERVKSGRELEQITVEAAHKFDVEFNDIWELLK